MIFFFIHNDFFFYFNITFSIKKEILLLTLISFFAIKNKK